ncbi:beta-ketoacyl-[acyl-carrier-protein] synthase family protein [Aequorivita antarctica]|nr:beta-ketoacyl-[acyl-carrier-protein] synthase family protein [Aequorivita antarctica]SRX76204.1 3-oxoacyl-[acyl-carrier-protein] synthase 2 [Aequorivita antarctica]
MRKEVVVVSGMGVMTPLGNTVEQLWQNILQQKCAAKHWDDLETEGFRTSIACRLTDSTIPQDGTRGQMMALRAVEQALKQANIEINRDVGVFVGTTMGESFAFEEAASGKPLDLSKATGTVFATAIQKHFNLEGPTAVFGTACAAGNYAIGAAAQAVRSGRVKVAIAGGLDPFSRIAMVGFSRSRAMTPDFCRPFDVNRKGMQLGEGAAFLILESYENVLKRKEAPLAIIGELGLSCDAYHQTKPNEDGYEMGQAMHNALKATGIKSGQVNWICAHGSGTIASDAAEALAIHNIFGERNTLVSGLKGALGHSLGAATAIEAVICVQSLLHNTVPPTVNHIELPSDFGIKIAAEPFKMENMDWVLNCGYAFGGINSALLIGKV